MVALAMTLLIGMAALAVDLGVLRSDIRSDRLVADASSTAGVAQINPFSSPDAAIACQTAWEYSLLNLGDDGSEADAPNCGATFSGTCDPSEIRQASGTTGPYTVTISHPVPNGHQLMGQQAPDPDIDGSPCQRLAVTVQRHRAHAFAPVIGFDSNTTTVHSVARVGTRPGENEIVPLLILEPRHCAIYTSGQGKVTVSYNADTETPGIIVVDSDASTCSPPVAPFSIHVGGATKGWIRAIPVPGVDIPSAILSYTPTGILSGKAYDHPPGGPTEDPVPPGDIIDPTEPAVSRFRLFPEPIPMLERITRKPIDWRYNCKSSYPDYPLVAPSGPGIPVDPCPFTTAPHIDNHRGAYLIGVPSGYQSWMAAGHSCSPNNEVIDVPGNWHIDCPPSGPNGIALIVNGGSITIRGNVLMNGGLDLRSDARFVVNPDDASDRFVFVREGIILKRAQATLILNRTFVYLHDGAVDIRAGSSTPPAACLEDQDLVEGICWTAPLNGNFEDLALWSEAHRPHEIGGQGGNNLSGTFFTPMAEPFGLDGQGKQLQFRAQFITRRLEVKGTAVVSMVPDPDRSTGIPVRAVSLIR